MAIQDKITKYLGKSYLREDEMPVIDSEVNDEIIAFLSDLDEDSLDDEMVERLETILTKLTGDEPDEEGEEDPEDDDDDDESDEDDVNEARMMHRTSAQDRRQSKLYYRRHRSKILARLRRLKSKIKRMHAMGRGLGGKRLGLFKHSGPHKQHVEVTPPAK